MPTLPDSDDHEIELRRRIGILKDALKDRKVTFAPEALPEIEKSLLSVRTGPDGQVDLTTVDPSVRALALAVTLLEERTNIKAANPLRELQAIYFEHLHRNFGHIHRQMKARKLTPNQFAMGIANDSDMVTALAHQIPDFLEPIAELWTQARDVTSWHLEDSKGIRAIFGGDLFPFSAGGLASAAGVYVDTLILPDPFVRTGAFLENPPDKRRVHYLIKHALALLEYRDLALADVDPPIVAIVPDREFFDENYARFVRCLAENDHVVHLQKLFSRNFNCQAEANDFLNSLETQEAVLKTIKDSSRLLFDALDRRPIPQQFAEFIDKWTTPLGIRHAGKALGFWGSGRMMQINSALQRSRLFGGTPIIDAPTSWQFFQWKLEYDSARVAKPELGNLHIVRGLQSAAAGEMEWLGRVPHASLIEMRRQNVLPELRAILAHGIDELMASRPANFYRTSDQVLDNLQHAFDAHRQQLQQLRGKKWRFAGVELAGCVVHGAVEIASACGVPFVSLINSVIDQVGDLPKLRELPERYRQLRSEQKTLDGSAVGILFRIAK